MSFQIDPAFLAEIQKYASSAKFRLPDMPELPAKLRGAVKTAGGLLNLLNNAVGLLTLAENDFFAAENESRMARTKSLSAMVRMQHTRHGKKLREQADRRQVLAYAKIIAVGDAVAL